MAAMRIQPHCVDLGCGKHIQTRDADFHKGRTWLLSQSYMPWIWEESPHLPSIQAVLHRTASHQPVFHLTIFHPMTHKGSI